MLTLETFQKDLPRSFKRIFQDFPIVDMLDNEFIQSLSPSIDYELQDQDDKSFLKQTLKSVGTSSQILSKSLQGDTDGNNILVSWNGGHPEHI